MESCVNGVDSEYRQETNGGKEMVTVAFEESDPIHCDVRGFGWAWTRILGIMCRSRTYRRATYVHIQTGMGMDFEP